MELGIGFVLVAVAAVVLVIGALAPTFYAARSGDRFTFVVSIVALAICVGLLIESRATMNLIVVAIVYLASAVMAVGVFATTRIEAALKEVRAARGPA